MKERRKHRRFSASHHVSFSYNGRTRTSNTVDLSLGGVRIETVFPVKVGEVIQVSIVIGGNTISPVGRVVHGRERLDLRYDAGFYFEALGQEERDYLLSYLARLSRP
ncbi:MAG: PilZ domain-containing protein [Deltaproteobacteria bacterium]|nr:PilZ domain-containing protein [Deltaproteobacteria bacterium]